MEWWVGAAIAVIVLLGGLYLSMTAGRLDRLHQRIDSARLSLDNQLLRRSSICIELATSGVLDPVTSAVLADAAHAARGEGREDGGMDRTREAIESDLTRTLLVVFADSEVDTAGAVADLDPEAAALVGELAAACRRVELARRFLNDGVRACRQVRRQRMVRWFALAGRTPWPETVELDDTPPPALAGM